MSRKHSAVKSLTSSTDGIIEPEKKIRNPFLYKFITNWLITDPDIINDDSSKKKYNYQVQNHKDMKFLYLFGGRWHLIKQSPVNLGTLIIILIPGILYFIFESKWIWHNITPGLVILQTYFWLMSLLFFFKASTSDPGQLPRNIHLPLLPNRQTHSINNPPQEYFNTIKLPYYKDNQIGVTIRYCPTCHIWRPPRTSHCSTCNICIKIHDHHCGFLNNCIGHRNYQYFLWLLLSGNIACILLIIQSIVHVLHYRMVEHSTITSFHASISKYPIAFLLVLWGLLSLEFPLALMLLHIYLTAQNITTREFLNYVVGKHQPGFVNVYDTKSILNNLFINWISKPRGNLVVRPMDPYNKDDIRYQHIEPLQTFDH
ncbi:Palmitoyltransferase ERF2 [Scheffersomyces amazonensis]|uniref:Palmitoyltransferase ERF2 n=1 Tax=Scheffersomyces amazonensis TaxID=1078765 RepID=UPI00315DF556